MQREEIIKKLNSVFAEVLDNDNISLTETSSAKNVEDWNSLNHILLVSEIETQFKIKFTASEIQSWANVGEMCNTIAQKLSK
jgi:acyl carrier protein